MIRHVIFLRTSASTSDEKDIENAETFNRRCQSSCLSFLDFTLVPCSSTSSLLNRNSSVLSSYLTSKVVVFSSREIFQCLYRISLQFLNGVIFVFGKIPTVYGLIILFYLFPLLPYLVLWTAGPLFLQTPPNILRFRFDLKLPDRISVAVKRPYPCLDLFVSCSCGTPACSFVRRALVKSRNFTLHS